MKIELATNVTNTIDYIIYSERQIFTVTYKILFIYKSIFGMPIVQK